MAKPLRQVRQEHPGTAAEIGNGLGGGGGHSRKRLPKRVLNAGGIGVEKQLGILRYLTIPVAILVVKLILAQRSDVAPANSWRRPVSS